MDLIDGILLGFGIFTALFILAGIIFTLWMFIHGIIRTVEMWPEENILNILMLILMLLGPAIGAIVYFFVCYRKSSVLRN